MWLDEPYTSKIILDDKSMFITDNGERVRSKSEINIANALNKYHIPYKYECPLTFNSGMVIYPDFTIFDVKNRKEIYWEHRGMMDDREYVKYAVLRVKEYNKNEIYLGKNLIITEETSANPLGTKEIENVIRTYFIN